MNSAHNSNKRMGKLSWFS